MQQNITMSIAKCFLLAAAVAPALAGCATLWPSPAGKDSVEDHKAHKTEMIESFEAKRDAAQFDAAMVRWREGDIRACKELVDKLVMRNPKHRGGRLLRAEIQLDDDKPELAIADVEALVKDDPKDAEASHLLGLLLEAAGRSSEAMPHFERAAQIAPNNHVFAASFQSALVGEPSLEIEGVVATDASPNASSPPMTRTRTPADDLSLNRRTRNITRPTR